MSVLIYDPTELQQLAASYRAIRPLILPYGPDEDTFDEALFVAHMANVSAFCLTYGNGVAEAGQLLPIPELLEAAPIQWDTSPDVQRAFVKAVRGLQYNCVSNGGTDFLPARYGAVLDHTITRVLDVLAGID